MNVVGSRKYPLKSTCKRQEIGNVGESLTGPHVSEPLRSNGDVVGGHTASSGFSVTKQVELVHAKSSLSSSDVKGDDSLQR